MFIDLLEEKEKNALMGLLVNIAKADGNIDEAEKDFLEKYANEHGVDLNIESNVSISDSCRQISSKKAKVVAMQEIIKLAIVDGNYDEAEKAGAMAIAEMLGIENDKFKEIEKWVLDGQQWVKRGIEMLG